MLKIKIDAADKLFSIYIRTRDHWQCQRCKTIYPEGRQGLQNSHYFGRGCESTRFDPGNCCSLCFACHEAWGSRDREAYRDFMIKKLGEKGFQDLLVRSSMTVKKDRELSLLAVKQLLADLDF